MASDLSQSRLDVQQRGSQPAMFLVCISPAVHLVGVLPVSPVESKPASAGRIKTGHS
jgi:hypothetical protein